MAKRRADRGACYYTLMQDAEGVVLIQKVRERGDSFDESRWQEGNYWIDIRRAKARADKIRRERNKDKARW